MSAVPYRGELDGVRAIAVLSVVLFHVGYPDMKGGYVGVDVFFVLSGYLICGQTYMRLERGDYSVTEFFARRIRRLSTAYFLCFLVTALVANAYFLRSEMQVVADGFLGSVTFTNNFNLMSSAGYFAAPAHENPFLHTWSLSIEEQFYIVLPMLILLTRRSRGAFAGLLAALFAVSLALTLFSGELIHDREARFFSSAFRVWELAAGGLIFVLAHHRLLPPRLPLAPLAGLALVVAPVKLLDSGVPYPGWATLLPVAGTVLLIAFAAPGHSPVARWLASRPLVYVGRISYGTYLWHWPLVVGAFYYGLHMTDVVRGVLVLASLGLGALSYHLVETPVRRMPVTAGKGRLYGVFAGQCVVMLAVAAYLVAQPGRAEDGQSARLEAVKAEVMNVHDRWNACWGQTEPGAFCRVGEAGAAARFIVWGDSMANSAVGAFDAWARRRGVAGMIATEAACAPLAGVAMNAACLDTNSEILAYLDTAPSMEVILMARWSFYAEGYGHYGDTPGRMTLLGADGHPVKDTFAAFANGLDRVLERLGARHRVTVINQFPVYGFSVPKAMLRDLRFGTGARVQTRAAFDARNGRTIAAVRAAAERHGARHIAPHRVFCDDTRCDFQMDGRPLFVDHVHLSRWGNAVLGRLLPGVDIRERDQ
ncbi:SGNH hydrolase domain-containing protein [Roseovarius salis]|uniref:acyltransferase family protein n=1 Tax=Roseovarius salis TaxID=3376063 RepID=UPI0037CA32FA